MKSRSCPPRSFQAPAFPSQESDFSSTCRLAFIFDTTLPRPRLHDEVSAARKQLLLAPVDTRRKRLPISSLSYSRERCGPPTPEPTWNPMCSSRLYSRTSKTLCHRSIHSSALGENVARLVQSRCAVLIRTFALHKRQRLCSSFLTSAPGNKIEALPSSHSSSCSMQLKPTWLTVNLRSTTRSLPRFHGSRLGGSPAGSTSAAVCH